MRWRVVSIVGGRSRLRSIGLGGCRASSRVCLLAPCRGFSSRAWAWSRWAVPPVGSFRGWSWVGAEGPVGAAQLQRSHAGLGATGELGGSPALSWSLVRSPMANPSSRKSAGGVPVSVQGSPGSFEGWSLFHGRVVPAGIGPRGHGFEVGAVVGEEASGEACPTRRFSRQPGAPSSMVRGRRHRCAPPAAERRRWA